MMRVLLIVSIVCMFVPVVSADGLCPSTGIRCVQNQETYEPGDHVILSARVCNGHPTESIEGDLFLVLDVFGSYFFYPSWSTTLDYVPWTIPACSCEEYIFLDFIVSEQMLGFNAYAAFIVDDQFIETYFCMYAL